MTRRAGLVLAGLLGVVLVLSVLVNTLVPPPIPPSPPASVGAGGTGGQGSTPRGTLGGGPVLNGFPSLGGLPWPLGRGARGVGIGREAGLFGLAGTTLGGVTGHLASLVTLLLAGLGVLYALPGRVGRIAGALGGRWSQRLRLGAVGLAAGLLALAFGTLALLTIAGPAIAVTIIALSYLGGLIGLTAISLPLGRWIMQRGGLAEQPPAVDLLAGLLGLFLISLLPILGGIVFALAALVGLGATIQTRAGSARPWSLALPDLDY
ncbi:MAG: hypothetical protein M3Z04_04030 [Chloroflexota bacterium]|nr:hypothetical protein [Chloroflexota bacterium]